MEETAYGNLSFEHILPEAVGGDQYLMTCEKCNNDDGSWYDSQVSSYQESKDALLGFGTIPAKIYVEGSQANANVEWGDGYKDIAVVGKASNPQESESMEGHMRSERFDEMKLELSLGYCIK